MSLLHEESKESRVNLVKLKFIRILDSKERNLTSEKRSEGGTGKR